MSSLGRADPEWTGWRWVLVVLVIVVALGLALVLANDEGPATGPRLDPEVRVGHVRSRPMPLVRRPDWQPWGEWEPRP